MRSLRDDARGRPLRPPADRGADALKELGGAGLEIQSSQGSGHESIGCLDHGVVTDAVQLRTAVASGPRLRGSVSTMAGTAIGSSVPRTMCNGEGSDSIAPVNRDSVLTPFFDVTDEPGQEQMAVVRSP